MDDEKIKDAVRRACEELKNESNLFTLDVNERTISHRLATILSKDTSFSYFHIDCEYNRFGSEPTPKRLPFIKTENKVPFNDVKGSTVFPDIIIHKRGTKENLLVIEVKKDNNKSNGTLKITIDDKDKEVNPEEFDIEKLKLFTKRDGDFAYQLGIYILFDEKGDSTYKYFKDGEESDD